MKTIDMLRPVTLGFVTLLSVSLLPVAHAEHNHERDDGPVTVSHKVRHEHASRHERHSHHHRLEVRRDGYHHVYDEKKWPDRPHHVVWKQPFNQPRLIIRLPWLIVID